MTSAVDTFFVGVPVMEGWGMELVLAAGLCFASVFAHSAQIREFEYTSYLTGTETYLAPDSPPPLSGLAVYETQAVTGTYTASLTVLGHGRNLTITDYDVALHLSDGSVYDHISYTDLLWPTYQTSTGKHSCAYFSYEIDGCLNFAGGSSTIDFTSAYAKGNVQLSVNLGSGQDSFSLTSPQGCSGVPYTDAVQTKPICSQGLTGTSSTWKKVTAAPEIDSAGAGAAMALLGALTLLGARRRSSMN